MDLVDGVLQLLITLIHNLYVAKEMKTLFAMTLGK